MTKLAEPVRKKLTSRVVAAAKVPDVGKEHVWDTEVPGFALRVYASGRKSYMVKVTLRGRQRWMTIGAVGETVYDVATDSTVSLTPTNARKVAEDWRAFARAGIDPKKREQEHRDGQLTINELADAYLGDLATRKPTTIRAYTGQLVHVRDGFGRRRPAEITVDDVRRWHRSMKDKPSMANRALDRLGALMKDAARRGLLDEGFDPVRGVKRFTETSRTRFLSTKELAKLGATLQALEGTRGGISHEAAGAIRLLLLTGCRVGEVLGLRWADVDFERRVANLEDAKGGPRPVLLPEPALEVLRGLRRRNPDSAWVVPGQKSGTPMRNLRKAWYPVREAAKLPGVRLHDLRHTVGATGASGGASLPIVGEILGHRSVGSTKIYAHLADDPVREASDLIGATIADALATRPDDDDDEGATVQ